MRKPSPQEMAQDDWAVLTAIERDRPSEYFCSCRRLRAVQKHRQHNTSTAGTMKAAQPLFGELLQYLFPQLLHFAEEFLIFDEKAVEFERLVGGQLLAQNHVAHMHWIGQGGVFIQLFKRRIGIVMIHKI